MSKRMVGSSHLWSWIDADVRHQGVVCVYVDKDNPNGQAGAGGYPRLTPDGYGEISDVSFKEKGRRRLEDHKSPLFAELMAMAGIPESRWDEYWALESANRGFEGLAPWDAFQALRDLAKEHPELVLPKYWDYRMWGDTLLEKVNGQKGTGLKLKRTGCCELKEFRSIAPVSVITNSISKKYPIEQDKLIEGNSTFGETHHVEHGIYVSDYTYNAHDAVGSDKAADLALFYVLAKHACGLAQSSSRVNCPVITMYDVQWDNLSGGNQHKWLKFLKAATPKVKEGILVPKGIEDYDFPDDASLKKMIPEALVTNIMEC